MSDFDDRTAKSVESIRVALVNLEETARRVAVAVDALVWLGLAFLFASVVWGALVFFAWKPKP